MQLTTIAENVFSRAVLRKSETIHFALMSDAPRDLGGYVYQAWSSSSLASVRKIWRSFYLSISRPGDIDLWPLTLKLVHIIARGVYQFRCFWYSSYSTYGPISVRRTTWPFDLHLWAWWQWRFSVILVFVLHLYTKKFQIR